ncbi:MAG: 30S ribosomal protein S26e [Thermoproteales archaeon]|nr:30S ribosomal protein S26e [Thermoproteales archaeon]
MPVKRRSRGRKKGGKGKEDLVQCDECGALVPRSKAVRVTRSISYIDPQLARELRQQGAIIPTYRVTKYYCIRCAIHRGIRKIRSEEERQKKPLTL